LSSLAAGKDWIAVTGLRVVGGGVDVVVVVVAVVVAAAIVIGADAVVVVVVVVVVAVVVAVVVFVVAVGGVVLGVGANGLLVGLGLLELATAGGRGRVTKPGSVVACQIPLGAVCAGAHELTMALLADSIVLSLSAAGSGDPQLLHINYASITHPFLGPTQNSYSISTMVFPGGWGGGKLAWGVLLTSHLHLAPSLRMSGAIPLLPLVAFSLWTGQIYLFLLIHLGHAVVQFVEVLHYKPEGRGCDSRWSHWNFSVT
jgi:hypothetical protein